MTTATAQRNEVLPPNSVPPNAVQPRQVRVVEDQGPLSYLFDTARFEHLQRIALMMANQSFTPMHLKVFREDRTLDRDGTLANCFRVVNQAIRWGFDPFAVCDETYVVQGKLGYQGKLVIAVINARAGLRERLTYEHSGAGADRTVKVTGHFKGESEPREITLSVKQAATKNDMWTKDPDQKLVYSGSIKWARRHCPEIIMGVLTDEDLERIQNAETTPPTEVKGRLDLRTRKADQPNGTPPAQTNGDGANVHTEPVQEPHLPAGEPTTKPTKTRKANGALLARVAELSRQVPSVEYDTALLRIGGGRKVSDLTADEAEAMFAALRPMVQDDGVGEPPMDHE